MTPFRSDRFGDRVSRSPPRPGFVLIACAFALAGRLQAQDDRRIADFVPDPASVTRWEQGSTYPQAGFRVLHIEGAPLVRGRQHGRLLAREIADLIATLSSMRSTAAPLDAWRDWRTMAQAWFLPGFDREWREEMRGIAEGAAAAGATVGTRAVDFLDIVTVNCAIELDFLENALDATPLDVEPNPEDHCSAFAATGEATADGHVVFGHITMWSTAWASRFSIWLDVQPAEGHRVVLQTFPGGIWSGTDFYQNGAGLLLAETTIGQTKFERGGKPLAQRTRQAMQYSGTIDEAVKVLGEGNNGLYSNEWLLADTKTDEIAMFELGTHKSRLWRSKQNEWFGGTTGFYWGCNNAKDAAVRLETIADARDTTTDLTWRPSDRDRAWVQLYEAHKGRIDTDFGFRAFTLPPLCAARSLDAKFTTTALAANMDSWTIFGPPIGPAWVPTEDELRRNPHARPMVGNDWTILGKAKPVAVDRAEKDVALREKTAALTDYDRLGDLSRLQKLIAEADELWPAEPSKAAAIKHWLDQASDLEKRLAGHREVRDRLQTSAGLLPYTDPPAGTASRPAPARPKQPAEPSWSGTVLASSDADIWLPAAIAGCREALSAADPDLAAFAARSRAGIAERRLGRRVELAALRPDVRQADWYEIAAGKGTLLMLELRRALGDERFDALMRDFLGRFAGKAATTADFVAAAEASAGGKLDAVFSHLQQSEWPATAASCWSIGAFEKEPEQALIVYGSQREARANREAAEMLQRRLAARWHNFQIPVRKDSEVTESELSARHLVLVGRPACNVVTARCAAGLPVRFGEASFVLDGVTCGRPDAAVVAAGDNPFDPRRSVVVFAGLSADATWRLVRQPKDTFATPCEALVLVPGEAPRPWARAR